MQKQFCNQQMHDLQTRIKDGTDTSVVGMPGVGISTFLIELSKMPFGYMLFIDAHTLPKPTTADLCAALLQKLGGNPQDKSPDDVVRSLKSKLEKLAAQEEHIVISIGGFDQLQAYFDHELFHTLITLKGVSRQKIVFMFGVCRRLDTLVTNKMIDTDLRLLSSIYYLKPFAPDDLRHLLPIYGSKADLSHPELETYIKLSGGHFQFLRLLLASERQHSITSDPFIKLAFQNIYSTLSAKQKAILKQIATRGSSTKSDEFLLGTGIIKPRDGSFVLFSELFADCIRAYTTPRLPSKELKLLRLLKKNLGRVVPKQEIFDLLWPDEVASEWALNALVYRLRKHPAFTAQNYEIENVKKIGYVLTKN